MMKRFQWFAFIFFIPWVSAEQVQGQFNPELSDSLVTLVNRNIKIDKVKDSSAMYTFALKITVLKLKNGKMHNRINISDPSMLLFFTDLSFLRKKNLSALLRNNEPVTLIIPVAIYVTNVKNDKAPQIPIGDFNANRLKLEQLFYYRKDTKISFIYTKPLVLSIDKTIYN